MLVAKLEESLNSTGTVLRTLTIITVGEQEDETLFNVPLSFSRGDHGIDNNLGTIGKITELGFPDGEGVGVGLGVSILVTEDSVL